MALEIFQQYETKNTYKIRAIVSTCYNFQSTLRILFYNTYNKT